MARKVKWLSVLALLAVSALACGGDEGGSGANTSPIGTGGAAGMLPLIGGTTAGGAGGPVQMPPPVGGGGMAGITSAGGGGLAGTMVMPAAGGGSAGTMAMPAGSGGTAGSDGMAGSDMAGGSGSTDPGDGIQREADPTMMSAMDMGEYNVDSYTDGMRDGPAYAGATIYYPTDADPPFAAVTIVPGFTAYQNSIADWGPFLASHGIIAMTIDTNTTGDLPDLRADGLMDALMTIEAENTRSGSPLEGKVDTSRFGVAGWSMGGGGTLIAAANNPTLKAAVSFAAWGPTGGAMNKVPALMFEATADILAASMSDGYYQETPDSTPKMLFEVEGSSHNVANSPNNHDHLIGLYGLSWFKVFLEDDSRYRQFLTADFPSICTDKSATNVM